MSFLRGTVEAVVPENPRTRTIYFAAPGLEAVPGQFLMVFVPGMEEIPISLSGLEDGIASITVAAVGETSKRLTSTRPGETLFYRGPFGRGFDLSSGRRYLLVGGGYGTAPLAFAADVLLSLGKRVTVVEGARTKEDLILLDRFPPEANLTIATEDGSAGRRGTAVEAARYELEMQDFDSILACGPPGMIEAVLALGREFGVEVQVSLERLMKCGIGICGSCVLEPKGLLVCRDGPVFRGRELEGVDLAAWRDWSGRLVHGAGAGHPG